MDTMEQSLASLSISPSNLSSAIKRLQLHRSYLIAPDIAINGAASALKGVVLQDGLGDSDALQDNIQRVVYILYDDEKERQPEESRTLAYVAVRVCKMIGEVDQAVAKDLRGALVAHSLEMLKIAWNYSEQFSEMDYYENANFRARTNTVADFYALGLLSFDDFLSSFDHLLPKAKDAQLFDVLLFDFVGRGLTHTANKLPRGKWDRLYLRLPAIPRHTWDLCYSEYEELSDIMEVFDLDLKTHHPYCTIPFHESTETGSWRRQDRLCAEIMAEVAGSGDKDGESLCMYMQSFQM